MRPRTKRPQKKGKARATNRPTRSISIVSPAVCCGVISSQDVYAVLASPLLEPLAVQLDASWLCSTRPLGQ